MNGYPRNESVHSGLTPSGSRMNPIKRIEESENTKNKLTTYLINCEL